MNTITKVSDITYLDVGDYIRVDGEQNALETLLNVAKEYIKSYTGLDDTEIDEHADFVIVVLILCQDMYDNRTMYVDKDNVNKVVDPILGMHSVNLL